MTCEYAIIENSIEAFSRTAHSALLIRLAHEKQCRLVQTRGRPTSSTLVLLAIDAEAARRYGRRTMTCRTVVIQ